MRNLLVKSALSGRGSRGVLVNGVDVSEVENHAVLTSGGPLVITGRKSFTNAFTAHHLVAGKAKYCIHIFNLKTY